jgi:phytanoyl-CoA hydroxylase
MTMLTIDEKNHFDTQGYLIVKNLFTLDEVSELRDHFMELSKEPIPGCFEPVMESEVDDPLKRYPRMMHPHRVSEIAKRYMLHSKVLAILRDLYREEPLAAQSMFYFKPPRSRGQALHQDNFYLQVEPGTCIAAWTAIDQADPENGGMLIVPKTNNDEIYCPESADQNESFTNHYVKPPKGKKAIPAIMAPGDVLFFNGNLIHGSHRNKSKNRFRRSFICHYASESTTKIGGFYSPLFRSDGSKVERKVSNESGPCGNEFDTVYPH